MKSLTEYVWFNTREKQEFINITDRISKIVQRSGIKEGLCLVNTMHNSSSVYINDPDRDLVTDFENWLEKLAPHDPPSQYLHNKEGEGNGEAHLRKQIMGREVVVAVTEGKLDLGTWERIFYGEFDGQRQKKILVKVIGE